MEGDPKSAALQIRELYCPAHFGNSYECMGAREMRDMLREAKAWGYNRYSDWFDAADLRDPYARPAGEYLLSRAMYDRKMAALLTAQDLGFEIGLTITPNHVYVDQLRGDLLADATNHHIFGQLLCPSKPEAREIILRNQENIFGEMAKRGVRLRAIAGAPYDYGGCGCSSCSPWIVTFGELFTEIHEAAKKYYPDVQACLIGWWWSAEEHALFKEWADAKQPGRFSDLAAHILYGETGPDETRVRPQGCRRRAFVHIGYADNAEPRDVYGHWGAVVAAERIQRTVQHLRDHGHVGFMAYSEGLFDDVNKALLGGLSSGMFASAQDVLRAYAERYFGAKGGETNGWARWMAQWGSPFDVDLEKARADFENLRKSARPGWRLEQIAAKLRLIEIDAAVRSADDWRGEKGERAEEFWAEKERLRRRVWGLGPVRHVFHDGFCPPVWYDEWLRVTRTSPLPPAGLDQA